MSVVVIHRYGVVRPLGEFEFSQGHMAQKHGPDVLSQGRVVLQGRCIGHEFYVQSAFAFSSPDEAKRVIGLIARADRGREYYEIVPGYWLEDNIVRLKGRTCCDGPGIGGCAYTGTCQAHRPPDVTLRGDRIDLREAIRLLENSLETE